LVTVSRDYYQHSRPLKASFIFVHWVALNGERAASIAANAGTPPAAWLNGVQASSGAAAPIVLEAQLKSVETKHDQRWQTTKADTGTRVQAFSAYKKLRVERMNAKREGQRKKRVAAESAGDEK
jgi:hypothetical protein